MLYPVGYVSYPTLLFFTLLSVVLIVPQLVLNTQSSYLRPPKIAVIRGAYHQTALVNSTKCSYKNVSPSSRSRSRIWGYNVTHLGVLDFGVKQILSSG